MSSEHNLRFEFVGMLFALAIGQVAIECGDIVMKDFLKEGGRISKDSLSQPTKDKMDKDLPVTIELEYTNFDYWARVILYIVLPFLAIIVSTFLYFTI